MNFKRVWRPVNEWEEIKYGMWDKASDKKKQLAQAIEFTGDHERYGHYMRRVAQEWPVSCENALTDKNLNRKAWIGHAACALALNIPEHIVREAWGHLNDEQRTLANAQAAAAISKWELAYAKSLGLPAHMARPLL